MAQEADKEPADSPESPADGEGFLSRWSRRKQAARDSQERADHPASSSVSLPSEHREPPAEEIRELTDQDMPPLESLDENSDYSGFLSPKVSDDLRRLALRKLFHLPQFNVTDGLDDYAEDFTTFQGLGGVITQEMRRLLEREKARALAAEGEPEDRVSPESVEESTGQNAQGTSQKSVSSAVAGSTDAPEDPAEDSV